VLEGVAVASIPEDTEVGLETGTLQVLVMLGAVPGNDALMLAETFPDHGG